jgi:hypothetical protein
MVDATKEDWDNMAGRFYDNRPFPKDVKPDCLLVKDEDYDPVDRPRHYATSEVECIDYIHMMLGSGVNDYLRGQVYKYMHRHQLKGEQLQDLKKAQFYLSRLIYELEQQGG